MDEQNRERPREIQTQGSKEVLAATDTEADDFQQTQLCPICAEEIKSAAKKCKHCGEWLDDQGEGELGDESESRGADFVFGLLVTVGFGGFGVGALLGGETSRGFLFSVLVGYPVLGFLLGGRIGNWGLGLSLGLPTGPVLLYLGTQNLNEEDSQSEPENKTYKCSSCGSEVELDKRGMCSNCGQPIPWWKRIST